MGIIKKERGGIFIDITFIHHSCYTVETEDYFFVFDYFQGELIIPPHKQLVFVVSHSHSDHFHPSIFDYKDRSIYILSYDVPVVPGLELIRLRPGDEGALGGLSLRAFGSTDEGISLLIEAKGRRIYFSGDLNFWLWPRYTATDVADMARDFTREVDAAALGQIDLAFGVVDPRMGQFYHLSGEYFIRKLRPRHFFPLHLWGDFELSDAFKEKYQGEYPETQIHSLQGDGQQFTLDL
ncbi:MAG: MBL fold metallo-hydrolase [Tissierellia bacterium]|nr:MBL fold metallo-hydrolase [Tissierellia bacterium]